MKSRWPWVLLVIGLPLAALGILSSPNEYGSWGAAGIDCDGPALLVFALPAIALYLVCATALARRAYVGRKLSAAAACVVCLALVVALAVNGFAAFSELSRPEHQASCA